MPTEFGLHSDWPCGNSLNLMKIAHFDPCVCSNTFCLQKLTKGIHYLNKDNRNTFLVVFSSNNVMIYSKFIYVLFVLILSYK